MARTTGKDHARINLDIWGDDAWLDCEPDAQHLYMVLWTSPQLSYCGAGDWNPGRIATRSKGWTPEAVEIAGAKLSRDLFLIIDTDTDEFLMRSWVKHDGLWRTPNMAVSVANARAELASRTLRGIVVHEVTKIRAKNPESSSWTREAVEKMLSQKAIDPTTLESYNPVVNPTAKGGANPYANPWVNPSANPTANPGSKGGDTETPTDGVNPGSNPGATPTPSPTPSPIGGYVSTEGYVGDPTEPPTHNCSQHPNGTTDPCRACGDARRAHAEHQAQQRREAARIKSSDARERAELRAQAILECDLCDDDGYAEGRPCDHDPDTANRAERGIAAVRAELARVAAAKTNQEPTE